MTALIYCSFPDEGSALEAGRVLLDEGLAACINVGSPIRSVFVWQGLVEEGVEVAAVLKTQSSLLGRAIARLEDLHPYDSPAILGWHCEAAGSATQAWLAELRPGE